MKNLSLRNEIARLEREIELQRKKNDGNERIFR